MTKKESNLVRDAGGKYVKGHPGGPGPGHVSELRKALCAAVINTFPSGCFRPMPIQQACAALAASVYNSRGQNPALQSEKGTCCYSVREAS